MGLLEPQFANLSEFVDGPFSKLGRPSKDVRMLAGDDMVSGQLKQTQRGWLGFERY